MAKGRKGKKRPMVARAAKSCAGKTKGKFRQCVREYMRKHK